MPSLSHLWLCSFLYLSFFLGARTINSEELPLSGQVFKVEYQVPAFVANPPCGWYLQLDDLSQKKLLAFRSTLLEKDRSFYGEFDTSIVRLCSSSIQFVENKYESFNGRLWQMVPLSGPLCFDFDVCHEDRFDLRECYETYPSFFSEREFPELDVTQEEQEIELEGVVEFQIFPGPGNYCSIEGGDSVEQCWYICVVSAQIPKEWDFPDVKGEKICIGRIEDESLIDQRVIVRGTLFNAHTAHHHTLLLMNVKTMEKRDS